MKADPQGDSDAHIRIVGERSMNGTPEAGRKLRVLVVEDDPDALTIYAESLRFAGCEVLAVMTKRAALDSARQARPDVIVLDCRLPDGDGLELLEDWRRSEVGRVPVVVVTASGARQEVEAALLAGAAAFVRKPCAGDALARFVAGVATRTADGARTESEPGRSS